jgi:glyceraldehyde-3-phosphate dehydrogenase type II
MSNIVHVVGTGTIGEPLIGLLADHQEDFGIDEVTFMKRTPMVEERGKVHALIGRGAGLAVPSNRVATFEELGHTPKYTADEALDRATVVIDCTPAGNANKAEFYDHLARPLGFLAQGSEFGFGKMYARGINDEAITPDDRFIQIVSCNTHNVSALIKTLAMDPDGTSHLVDGRFVLLRRSNDISQDDSFVPSPTVERHGDARFGTHHARDAHQLFETLGYDLPLHSSAMKLPTQYMHALWFSLTLDNKIDRDEVVDRLRENPRIALTHKRSANKVFSFGRDHGYFGRILNQAVVPFESLTVRNENEVVGFCFTSQDGNSLLSSMAATLRFLDPDSVERGIATMKQYFFDEV